MLARIEAVLCRYFGEDEETTLNSLRAGFSEKAVFVFEPAPIKLRRRGTMTVKKKSLIAKAAQKKTKAVKIPQLPSTRGETPRIGPAPLVATSAVRRQPHQPPRRGITT
jgi:hypothetical protein